MRDHYFYIKILVILTFWIQKPGDTVLLLGNEEHRLQTFPGPLAAHSAPVDEVRPVSVDDRAEGQAVSPGLGEVLDLDAGVFVRGTFGPAQQIVFGGDVGLLADDDVGDLERKI